MYLLEIKNPQWISVMWKNIGHLRHLPSPVPWRTTSSVPISWFPRAPLWWSLWNPSSSMSCRQRTAEAGHPQNHPFSIGSFHYKPSILGYHHFWKPHRTYIYICIYLSLSLYIYIIYIYIKQLESYYWSQKSQKMMQNTRSKWSKMRSFGLNLGAASTVRRSISVTGPGFASPWLVLSSTASAGGGLRLLRISAHVEPLTDGWWGVVFQNTPSKGRKMLEGARSWSNPKRWA